MLPRQLCRCPGFPSPLRARCHRRGADPIVRPVAPADRIRAQCQVWNYFPAWCYSMGIVDNANNAAKEKWESSRTIKQLLKALGTWKKPLPLFMCLQIQVLKDGNAAVVTG